MTRTQRQKESINKWRLAKGKGTIKGCTGYGKTKCALDIIESINIKRGYDVFVGVVVPTSPLKKQWERKIEERGFKNVTIYTIQSFNEKSDKIVKNLWIYDEIHLYLNGEEFSKIFNKTVSEFELGLTGTLTEEEKVELNEILPIVDEITFEYAMEQGWVANLIEYNLYVELSKEELDAYNSFKESNKLRYSLYGFDADYMRFAQARTKNAHFAYSNEKQPSLKPGAEYVARKIKPYVSKEGEIFETFESIPSDTELLKGEELFEFLHGTAKELSKDFKAIKEMTYNFPSVVRKAKEVIEYLDMKTIVFGESNKAAEELNNILDNSEVYHSNLKTKIKPILKEKSFKTQKAADRNADKLKGKSFMRGNEWIVEYPSVKKITKEKQRDIMLKALEKGTLQTLVSSRCFVVGLDVYGMQLGINLSTTKKHTTHEQKLGRPSRKEGDKVAIFVNLIPNGTNVRYAYKEAQLNSKNIRHITNVKQITTE